MGGQSLPISVSPIWTDFSPLGVQIMRAVVTFLHNRGIRCLIYLDNLLLINNSLSTLREHTILTLDLLEVLSFLVNYPKSHLVPSQHVEYLGFLIAEGVTASKDEVRPNRGGSLPGPWQARKPQPDTSHN